MPNRRRLLATLFLTACGALAVMVGPALAEKPACGSEQKTCCAAEKDKQCTKKDCTKDKGEQKPKAPATTS